MKNVIALFVTVAFSLSVLANVSSNERDILIKLYRSTNGDQWTGWIQDLNATVGLFSDDQKY